MAIINKYVRFTKNKSTNKNYTLAQKIETNLYIEY